MKPHWTFNLFLMQFVSLDKYWKSKTLFKSSLNLLGHPVSCIWETSIWDGLRKGVQRILDLCWIGVHTKAGINMAPLKEFEWGWKEDDWNYICVHWNYICVHWNYICVHCTCFYFNYRFWKGILLVL